MTMSDKSRPIVQSLQKNVWKRVVLIKYERVSTTIERVLMLYEAVIFEAVSCCLLTFDLFHVLCVKRGDKNFWFDITFLLTNTPKV